MTAEKLLEHIERALRTGRVVTVAEKTLQMPVFEGRALDLSKSDSFTWGFYVQIDDLDLVLRTPIAKLTDYERDALSVDLAFSVGIASFRADNAHRRSPPAFDETGGSDHSPSI